MTYFEIPLELSAETLIEEIYAEMDERFPGWEPAEGNPETWLIRAFVYRLIVPLAGAAVVVPDQIFDRLGEDVVNLPPQEATAATVPSTWTAVDTAGYTIPVGAQVDVATSGDESIGFVVVEAVEIPAGKSATEAGEVILEAIEPGAAGNDLSGSGELVDALTFVTKIDLVGSSSGGGDAETLTEYLTRLTDTMRTQAPRPVIAGDVEILARNIAGVARALALDNYNAETEESEQERTTSVALCDDAGAPCAAGVKTAVAEMLEAKREANYLFFVIDPTYTEIDVNVEIVVLAGFAQAEVETNVLAAITDFLSPANWGQIPPGDLSSWENVGTLRYQDLVTVVNNAEGVDYYTVLKVGKKGGSLETKDVTLTQPAPLPKPNTIQIGP